MLLCQVNYIQDKVKRLKWFNYRENILEFYFWLEDETLTSKHVAKFKISHLLVC